ncbi:uncharacterized protein J7T54_007661 [Emericellopsis cladophorae]|uniref:Deacetylase sirtuin-type domain-containing protein n=1 Tax=Emericellopsis cladophorae TaxID=2686198 RepID=A0A9P9XUW5_9HYPO|nr:uncharacterized protein J7T54_007661 [Emericellopsis cladophorae]KAI6778053.1 hypothetical protein J7T54_007661 [Emericellopsis cladophorae]
MPTLHIEPTSQDHLQDIANAILKARKVVVVTGAGISTNSGIPDFRSKNGLYSLIQAQYDAAARLESQQSSQSTDAEEESPIELQQVVDAQLRREQNGNEAAAEQSDDKDSQQASKRRRITRSTKVEVFSQATPKRVANPAPTSPLSSPPSHFWHPSSPLSSPPAAFFDSHALRSSSLSDRDSVMSLRSESSSESDADVDDNEQTEFSFRRHNKLPLIKGKDLFDAQIWADPKKTSVFYTFATSLRQKVRDCQPTASHHFIRHLKDRGKLVRCYTQNIDRIEEKVGLSTSLSEGPGDKGRFSRRSTANASQLSKMVREAAHGSQQPPAAPPAAGVECVYLHGSLETLACFRCKLESSWDGLETVTISGQQPKCPHCIGETTAREEKGKRALGVGLLRPNIILYGEEHPRGDLIGPIIEKDVALSPDVMLIMGTSLRVHGLKFIVREFAKAIHNNRKGKVIFINLTKPPESTWGDILDYWIQWDCDAWVTDLQARVPALWQEASEMEKKPTKPVPTYPVALRDHKQNGAYWTCKIMDELHQITGNPALARKPKTSRLRITQSDASTSSQFRASVVATSSQASQPSETFMKKRRNTTTGTANELRIVDPTEAKVPAKPRSKRSRKSAPAGAPNEAITSDSQPQTHPAPGAQPGPIGPRPAYLHGPILPMNGCALPPPFLLHPRPDPMPGPQSPYARPGRTGNRASLSAIPCAIKENPRRRTPKKFFDEVMARPSTKSRSVLGDIVDNDQRRSTISLPAFRPEPNGKPPALWLHTDERQQVTHLSDRMKLSCSSITPQGPRTKPLQRPDADTGPSARHTTPEHDAMRTLLSMGLPDSLSFMGSPELR